MSTPPAPSTPPSTPPAAKTQGSSNVLSILAMVFGVIAVFIIPILFGIIALVLGGVAKSRKEPLSTWGLVVAAVGLVLGLVLGAIVFSANN